MARKSKGRSASGGRKSKPKEGIPAPNPPSEPPAVVAVTVAWCITGLATLVCEVFAILTLIWSAWVDDFVLPTLAGLLTLSSLVLGVVLVVLLIVTLRVRPTAPPRPLIVISLVLSFVPLVILLFQLRATS